MKAIIKNSLLLTAVIGILIAPSCTQRQVGKGAAVVAVGTAIGAAVILDDANRRDGRYHLGLTQDLDQFVSKSVNATDTLTDGATQEKIAVT